MRGISVTVTSRGTWYDTMTVPPPSLPSVLPSQPALRDVDTSPELLEASKKRAKSTNPSDTPIFICGFKACMRLYPTKERLMQHRKRDHASEDESCIITWND
ncbi:hypothetical protein HGRIS_008137 [Hohenbuehelia grisea]|uniref:C2H2-type domain-containing protein n=1 Tax=Hohenbuehelia grisea TaxID=104357 RepID=A0ABR3J7G4_9AGAR